MGDSVPLRPRRRYARPGEIDTSILEVPSIPLRPDAEPSPYRQSPPPLPPIAESKPVALRPGIELNPNRKSLAPPPPGIAESKPIALRPSVELNPNRKSLAPPPGIVESKSVPLRPLVELNANRKSLAPPPWIVESKSVRLRSGVQLNSNSKSFTPLTRKEATVRSRVSAHFELLPDQQPRWGRMGLSAAGQLVFLGFVLLTPMIFPQQMRTALKFDVVELMQPVTEIHIAPATPPPPKIKPKVPPPEPKPVVPEPPPSELNPKQPHVFLTLKPELPKLHTVEAKAVELKPSLKEMNIIVVTSQPKPPKEDVKVGNLSSDNPAPVTVAAPVNKVQTGGFGDPNGIQGPGNPSRGANINQAGSPVLPGGPGYGNGTGGARGIRGAVAATGPGKNGSATGGETSVVDILDKPIPVYSTEARTLRVEGDVLLEVVFLASSQVQVTRVVSGLGHGLDEAAIQAAKRIHFKPAKRDGQPIDFPARVRIEFRLAN
jgi:TonB family protein